jgi:hypothetical protein
MMEYRTRVSVTIASGQEAYNIAGKSRVHYNMQLEPGCLRIEQGDNLTCGGVKSVVERVFININYDTGAWRQGVMLNDVFILDDDREQHEAEMIRKGWVKCT